jgi:nucleotide-binding universal stress UspA family protein
MVIPYDYMVEEPDGILLATNHFEENIELLRPVAELAKYFSARVHVSIFVEKERTEAADYLLNRRHLKFFADFLRRTFPGIVVKEELLDGKSFEETLESYGEKEGIDIVALVSYPKNFWEKLTGKSMTRKFALHSKVPVLALPAGAY